MKQIIKYILPLGLLIFGFQQGRATTYHVDGYVVVENIYQPVPAQVVEILNASGGLLQVTQTGPGGYFSTEVSTGDTATLIRVVTSRECSGQTITYHHALPLETRWLSTVFEVCSDQECKALFNAEQSTGDSLTFIFTDLSLGNINNWLWDFGDGQFSNEQNPVHTYELPDHYPVKLTVNGDNCSDTYHRGVFALYQDCLSKFSFQQITQGDALTVQFTDHSEGNIMQWFWDFGDGQLSNDQNPVHEYPAPGEYEVQLNIHAPACWNWSRKIVRLLPPPQCFPLFNAVQQPGDEMLVTFSDLSVADAISSWEWQFGDSTTASVPNPAHVYTSPGLYDVSLTITSAACSNTYTRMLEVRQNSGCTANFSWEQPDPEVPEVWFTATSANDSLQFQWNFGDGHFSAEKSPSHLFDDFGIYNVSLKVEGFGCSDSTSVPVQLIAPEICSAAFDYSQSAPQSPEITFINTSTGNNLSNTWDFGDGEISAVENPVHTYAGPGQYTVTLVINTAGNCSDSISHMVEIMPGFILSGEVFAGSGPLGTGHVMLYRYSDSVMLVGQQPLDEGHFEFVLPTPGEYFVQAFPDFDLPYPAIPEYFPVYSGDVLTWEQAMRYNTGGLPDHIEIHLASYNDFFDGHALAAGKVMAATRPDNLPMVLYFENATGEVFRYRIPDTGGQFAFDDIPYGNYQIRPEKAGKSGTPCMVELTEATPALKDLVFVETKTEIYPDLSGITEAKNMPVSINPNPADRQVEIRIVNASLPGHPTQITFYNAMGKTVAGYRFTTDHLTVPVAGFPDGLYVVEIWMNKEVFRQKILIRHWF